MSGWHRPEPAKRKGRVQGLVAKQNLSPICGSLSMLRPCPQLVNQLSLSRKLVNRPAAAHLHRSSQRIGHLGLVVIMQAGQRRGRGSGRLHGERTHET